MKKRLLFLSLISFSLMSGSCEKEDLSKLKGTYTGTFVYTLPESSVAPPPSGIVTVAFDQNTYTSSGNPDRIPAGGSGTFNILNDKQVTFEDKNMWTADFDWGLVLSGTYTYRLSGDSLYLSKYRDDFKVYEYRLRRQTQNQ